MTSARDRFEKMVEQAMDGYQWNARKRKSPINLRHIAVKLLKREHAAITRAVKRYRKQVGPIGQCIVDDVLALLAQRKGGTACRPLMNRC